MSQIAISNIDHNKDTLTFTIAGNAEYGLDKSVTNAIRRTLINDIPTVAFETDDNFQYKDINMITNHTSLHNEMILHRISLIPIFLNPEQFMKNYLFECKEKHTTNNPFQFITSNNFEIYPLKEHIQERISNLNDESKISDKEIESSLLKELLQENNPDNYQLDNPLNQKKKDEILRPFKFRDTLNYCLLTELKNTNSETVNQELHFYGSPSVKTGKIHARYQSVSCVTYTFSKDEELIQNILQEKLKMEEIDTDDKALVDDFTSKFMLRESERYYKRDSFNEPNEYEFTIKSLHYLSSSQLFMKSLTILIENCDLLKLSFFHLLQEKDTIISVEQKDELTFHYLINNYCHSIGNMLQSHIVRRTIDDKCIIQLCGYNKPHPLEDSIQFYCSLNPKHKVCKMNETQKFQKITSFLMEQLDEVMGELKEILNTSTKSFN